MDSRSDTSQTKRTIAADDTDTDAERTLECAAPIRASDPFRVALAPTRRMPQVDPRLLAIVRGEIDPEQEVVLDDPFGGLIPVYDEGEALDPSS